MVQVGIGWFLAAIYVFFRDVIRSSAFCSDPLLPEPDPLPGGGASKVLHLESDDAPARFVPQRPARPRYLAASLVFLVIVALGTFALGLGFFRRSQ